MASSPFVINTRIPSVQGNQAIQATPPLPTPQNNIFVYGNQFTKTYSPNDGTPVLAPTVGYPRYEFYKTYKLPAKYLNDPFGALSYFDLCGFTVGYGYTYTETLLNAAAVDITTYAASDNVIVYYTASSALIAPMVGAAVTGTFDDTTQSVTGTFVSAAVGTFVNPPNTTAGTYDSYVILHSSSFATVAAADTIVITFTNAGLLTPDPTQTDPFLMNMYQTLQAALIPINANSTVATPNVWFSLLPQAGVSGYFGATASAETLTGCTSVGSLASGNQQIIFALPSLNANLVPLSPLGATTITQATSLASGTVSSASINGGNLVVQMTGVTTAFVDTDVCTLHLDATQTIFTFQQALFANQNLSLQQLPCIYPILSNTNLTTTYLPIFTYVAALNEPATAQNGQAICQVPFANITIALNLAATTLPSATNSWQYEPIYYPYVPQVGDLPLTTGQLACAYAMVVGSNVAPLNPQAGVVINGLPVLANTANYVSTQINGIADQVMQLGWNVIAVNNNQQAYVVNPLTGQTTLPGLPTPDVEFFYEYVWQTVDYLRKGITLICQGIGLGQVRQTSSVIATLKAQIISFMLDMQTQGMLLNVAQNEAYLTIVQDPTNPLGIDIGVPTQIVPGLEDIYYTLNIFSSTVTLQTAA
jgi:hypothetical protein